jgi:hypothetical protein
MNFETQLFQYLENLKNNIRIQPLYLGGTGSLLGGSGGPPGGFIGYLPQTRISYDYSEIAASSIPISGMSLWDNLNHIRYRIQILEEEEINPSGVSTALVIEEDGTIIASGIYIINFVGATVTETETGEVTVTISSSGISASGITGINVESFTDITTLHFSGATVTNPTDNEVLISIDIPTPSGGGDMYKSVYDTNNDGIVNEAESVTWSGITNKPETYPPDSHTHDDRYYTETELSTSGQSSVNWGNLTDVPFEDSWQPLPTCTYVSATSFTLSGDWTSYLKLGARFKCTNSTLKFGYIFSSTYSSGTGLTTVNLISNTSYSLANAAISGANVSYGNPPDFQDWLTYTPTWSTSGTQPTLGDGTIDGIFTIVGKIAKVAGVLILGASTNPGTGFWYLTVPVTAGSNYSMFIGAWRANNADVANFGGVTDFINSTSIRFDRDASTYINESNPFTWGSGDNIRFTLDYPI